ncbi:imidazole glycerol phosphate synthase subunit HisH [Achromobacter sp. SIMBA_011]|uniref:imidazole glycerol phosphate synthase subunit HisH n=1 Tax=Achromobacter TaxID=222 RepID=UPI0011A1B9CE|nr:imidazole glycerol phosphate synthase subunit HisH [Achromobacter dolens]CAB3880834.1 Imidazole glycerol phosphate synthase subunit HisH [Achromobacter dolens]
MITVVDYGVGNIGALLNMFDYLGIDAQASGDADTIVNAQRLVLPGIGAFDKAMSTLNERNLVTSLNQAVLVKRTPVIGVCLGMQLLARRSDEGVLPGLGWIDADVRRIEVTPQSRLKVPHIGWADIRLASPSSLFPPVEETERFYFDHGYHMVCDNPADVAAVIDYENVLCCAVEHGNISGVQFHPEKSHRFGMRLLQNWAMKVSQ